MGGWTLKILTVLAAAALVGCSGSAEEKAAGTTKGAKPDVPQGRPSQRLVVRDLEVGSGKKVAAGDELLVHYVAGIYETGEEIESAWVSGNPLGFRLGSGEWSWGWERGMRGMRVGGRRELVFPATREESPLQSEPGDTLVYVVDLVDTASPSEQAENREEPEPSAPGGTAPDRLVIEDVIEGSGQAARRGDELTVNFMAVRYATGDLFESSWDWPKPFTFRLTRDEVIPGWVRGLPGMREGGRRQLIVPGRLAARYGGSVESSREDTLIYVVDLIEAGDG